VSRLVLWDLDGTLIDSRLDLALAVNHALRVVGLPERGVDEVVGFIGEGAARLVSRAVEPHLDRFEPALQAWLTHYTEHLLDHTVLYPGVAEALAAARATMAVHTNKPGFMARRILEGLGVAGRFAEVVGGDEAARKPDPSGTLALIQRLGAAAAETVLVGDSLVDLQLAANAGIRFVAVAWGLVPEERLRAGGATVFAHTAADLLPWLGPPTGP
jgi:phosphoglycolate phosphatase